ncbi:MAG: hypothetical protein IJQ21_08025 [Lachnospiraceae bacterium]|nr:hypothetical protein [Lachnospiraceae bacterium]
MSDERRSCPRNDTAFKPVIISGKRIKVAVIKPFAIRAQIRRPVIDADQRFLRFLRLRA